MVLLSEEQANAYTGVVSTFSLESVAFLKLSLNNVTSMFSRLGSPLVSHKFLLRKKKLDILQFISLQRVKRLSMSLYGTCFSQRLPVAKSTKNLKGHVPVVSVYF